MSKQRNFSEIAPNIAFPEFNFYELYYSTFEKSELGRIKKLLHLREMAETLLSGQEKQEAEATGNSCKIEILMSLMQKLN